MFGSSVLDVAIGLIFVFMAVSLAASALTEAIASMTKLRQATLRAGVQALLNDPDFLGLAKTLYNDALINPLTKGGATVVADLTASPAYIASSRFSLALVSILERDHGGADLRETVSKIPDPQIKQALTTLLDQAGDDRDAFLKAVGAWFDDAMDRVSGWYKRYTQAIGFGVALVICAILNADALRIGTALWLKPSLAAELMVPRIPDPVGAIDKLNGTMLLGWTAVPNDGKSAVLMVLGWLIVAGASLFGAPFWFDTLQRIVKLAGTGPAAPDSRKPAADARP